MNCKECELSERCEHLTPCVKDKSYYPITDKDRLDWLQEVMKNKDDYCEIFLAGLRNGNSDAESYQVESNPEKFKTTQAQTLRLAIDMAMLNHIYGHKDDK